MKLKRGYCYLVDLNPSFGTEPGKIRPVLLLQNDSLNGEHRSSLVCPITSRVRKEIQLLRCHLKSGEAGLNKDSDILLDQLRSIDNRRIIKLIGRISSQRLKEAEEKVKLILGFE